MTHKTAVSLFASSGIGDLALRSTGFKVLVANELVEERCELLSRNFPETDLVRGSIWERQRDIVERTKERLAGKELDLALITPPCQGMSKNGRGKLLAEIKAGRRPKTDERNLLIIPALRVAAALKPKVIVFENVPEMKNTVIPFEGEAIEIIELIKQFLPEYAVHAEVVEFADLGVPQRRQRLITIASRIPEHKQYLKRTGTLHPPRTHAKKPTGTLKPWVTVRDVISTLEPLDALSKPKSSSDSLHKVAKLDQTKHWWVSNTPAGASAFSNQCTECGFDGNLTHKSGRDESGVNRASTQTPIVCEKCSALLPRPSVFRDGKHSIMKGFTSAYKRMEWDLPASAITRNFPYACSDNKLHPEQNRTLSIREACLLHTINEGDYVFEYTSGKKAGMTAIRDTLGESIPPKALEVIFQFLDRILRDADAVQREDQQVLIF